MTIFSKLSKLCEKCNSLYKMSGGSAGLIEAIYRRHDDCVNHYIHVKGADVNEMLMEAVIANNQDRALLLLEAGADPNSRNKYFTCLTQAAQLGHSSILQLLVNHGACVNGSDNYGSTAIICAATRGRKKCLRILMETGADVNHVADDNNTALIRSVVYGHTECTHRLIQAGARTDLRNEGGNTALGIAAVTNNEESVRALLRAGSPINIKNMANKNALEYYISTRSRRRLDNCIVRILFAAGESLSNINTVIPSCLQEDDVICLQDLCRTVIRKKMIDINPHRNLFWGIPHVGLPAVMTSFLLYRITLDDVTIDSDDVASQRDLRHEREQQLPAQQLPRLPSTEIADVCAVESITPYRPRRITM